MAQTDALRRTLLTANAAAQHVSDLAWAAQLFHRYELQHRHYGEIRQRFGLSAQVAILVICKVATSYATDSTRRHVFRAMGAILYDERVLTWQQDQTISIWTLGGRTRVPYTAGNRQLYQLQYAKGQAQLVYRKGGWYIHQACELPTEAQYEPIGWLGIDMGIVSVAVDSDGTIYSGAVITAMRERRRRQRRRLQHKGTPSAKRVLRNLSGKERRYVADVNHGIAKSVVETARATGRGIAIEDLSGIRDRARARSEQRYALHSWAFRQLRSFIEHKAQASGVPVRLVDPTNTSIRCSVCGYTHRSNRRSQAQFLCRQCGHESHADHNAAVNISLMAGVPPTTRTDQSAG